MFLALQDPGTPWSLRFRSLAAGLTLYEENTNELGFPIREAFDPERDGWYEVDDETVDYSLAALEEYRRTTKNPEPGVQLKVKDTYEGDDNRPPEVRRPLGPPRGEDSLGDTSSGLAGTKDLSG